MTITYRSVKGSNLTATEVDDNFHDVDDRIQELEDNPPEATGISNITVVGTQMTIYLADATVLGPYTLPQANFRPSIVGELDAPTDGVYVVTNADSNRYWRYDSGDDLIVELPVTALADMEVTFRQVGAGALIFPDSTDVVVNGIEGFLNQTADSGSVVTCKFVEDGVWDLIGRLVAEDVTA